MEIIQKIKIDLLKPGVRPVVNVMQADVNSRVIEIALYANSVAWEIPDGASFSVAYKKPDGTSGLYDTLPDGTSASFAKGNVLSIRLAPQMLTVPGDVASSVAIFSSDQKISTFPVVVNVVQNPAAGATESEDYYWISTLAAIGNMDDLKTKEKSSLVAAINSQQEQIDGFEGGGSGVHILEDGETLDDVPENVNVVIDPYGEAEEPPVTSVNGQTGDVVIEIPEQKEYTVNGNAADENGNFQIDIPEGFSGSWNDLHDKPDIPTDEHINELINAALGAIPDASEVAF